MAPFIYQQNELYCDDVPLAVIAREVGTPVYVYSEAAIGANYRALDDAFAPLPHALHYALKANSNLAVLHVIKALGAGADANSGGEIAVALHAGFAPRSIIFTGVGKTEEEIDYALGVGVGTLNVESGGELERIAARARTRAVAAPVALRVNPDIDPQSHPYVSTGLRENKFGLPLDEAHALYRDAARRSELRLAGVHTHIGSQITSVAPLAAAARSIAAFVRELAGEGIRLRHVDLGGGLGIPYGDTPAPTVAEYAAALIEPLQACGCPLLLEPGRAIVGPAGALVSRVVDVKCHSGKRFVILDAGMTELLRPALYAAYHRIEPVVRIGEADSTANIVGPVCETSDTFARDRLLAPVAPGALVAILDVGAYAFVMASNYNRRPRPPEVLVSAGRFHIIRRRETLIDLLRGEINE